MLRWVCFFDIIKWKFIQAESFRIGKMKQILTFALFVVVFMPRVSVAEIPSVNFVDDKVSALSGVVKLKANDDAVVKLTGDQTIAGNKTFGGAVMLTNTIADTSNDNHVATTKWANDRVAAAKGDIPVGGQNSTTFTKIWIEE